jgi:hypothetical protein
VSETTPSALPVATTSGSTPKPPADPDRLVLLANDAMRARRRPFAIALVFLFEAFVAAALAYPTSAWVRAAYGAHPEGDAPLWRPGALALFDLLARAQVFSALGAHALLVTVVGALVGLLPLAILVTSMAYATPERRAPRLGRVVARAAPRLPALVGLLVVTALTQTIVLGLGAAAAGALAGATSLGEARAQQLAGVVLLLFLLLLAMIGVVHDLARTAAIRFEVGPVTALRLALNAWRRGVATTLFSWGWRAAVAWAPVAMGAFVAHRLGGRTGLALLFLLVLHQLIVLSRIALRASWLAKALRLVDDAHRVIRA